MAKKYFKISNLHTGAQSPMNWSIPVDKVFKKNREELLNQFVDDFRLAKLSVEDFIGRNI